MGEGTDGGCEHPPPAGAMTLEQDWDQLARLDPLWSILSFPDKRLGRWDEQEFLATGRAQVERHLAHGRALGHPQGHGAALDFGCGVGRLAPALLDAFGSYCGLDISAEMVAQARRLHATRSNCTFVGGGGAVLDRLPERSFDLVFTLYVLQHVPRRTTITSYVRSFVRLLRPQGLAVFQLPEHIPPAEKLLYDARRAAYLGLQRAGAPSAFLHRALRLSPMVMNFVPEAEVVAAVGDVGGVVLDVERVPGGMAIRDRTYYVTRGG
jgi:ubiquinone/menaquinone biosynthesis C-methylase UbiE